MLASLQVYANLKRTSAFSSALIPHPSLPRKSKIQNPKSKIITRAVVPAAGFGSRLRPLTDAIPKELLPVGRKTVLGHVLTELQCAGIAQVLFVVSERKPQIRACFGDSVAGDENLPPIRCEYAVQTEMRGSGDAVRLAEAWTEGESFVVAFGDCLIEAAENGAAPLRRLMEAHIAQEAASTVLVEAVAREKVSRYGVVAPQNALPEIATEPFALRDLVEKPKIEDAPSRLAVAARFALSPLIFDALRRSEPDTRGEQNLPDAMRLLLREGGPTWAVPLRPGEARRDIGGFDTFFAAFVRAALRDPEAAHATRQAIAEVESASGCFV